MSLNIDDLKRVQTLTWKELDYFLFHMVTKPDGSPLDRFDLLDKDGSVSRTSARIQRLFISAIEAGHLIPSKRSEKTNSQDWPVRKKEVVAWIIENEVIDLLKNSGLAIHDSKLKIFNKLLVQSKEQDFFNRTTVASWIDIGFVLRADTAIEVKIGQTKKVFSVQGLRKRFSGEKSWNVLVKIIHLRGQFEKDEFDGASHTHIKQYLTTLRNDLKRLFNIDDSPIVHVKEQGYKTKFSCVSFLEKPRN